MNDVEMTCANLCCAILLTQAFPCSSPDGHARNIPHYLGQTWLDPCSRLLSGGRKKIQKENKCTQNGKDHPDGESNPGLKKAQE